MGKIDEVSRVLGRLENAVKDIGKDTVQIRDHLKQINGKIVKNDEQTTKNTTDLSWIKGKSVAYGAGGGGILASLILIIRYLITGS